MKRGALKVVTCQSVIAWASPVFWDRDSGMTCSNLYIGIAVSEKAPKEIWGKFGVAFYKD